MFPFSQPANPVLRSHLDSQLAFFNDLTKTLASSFSSVCSANLKLSQTMIQESMATSQRMLAPDGAGDLLRTLSSRAQPASDTLRSYQRHLAHLAADVQVELARVTQQHAPEASRAARALADEVSRVATEDSARQARQDEESLKNYRDPFAPLDAQRGNGNARTEAAPQHAREGAGVGVSMQFDGLQDNGSKPGNVQGPVAQPAQQPDHKPDQQPDHKRPRQ